MNDDTWGKVREGLRRELGRANYEQWIEPLGFVSFDDGVVTLSASTKFICDWVERTFGGKILEALDSVGVPAGRMAVVVGGPSGNPGAKRPRGKAASKPAKADSASATPRRGDDIPGAPLDGRFTFDTFVVGEPNRLAAAAARRVAAGGKVSYNPLFLYGGVGVGKTHLMQAVAWEMRARHPGKRIVYLSAEQFMYQFVQALRDRRQIDFKSMFRSVDVLMVDDLQFIADKDSTQDEFFHTFNALVDQGSQIVISADRPPPDLEGIGERISSRLGSGLAVDLRPADFELRLMILRAKIVRFHEDHPTLEISPEVLRFIAERITSSVRELEGALNRLSALASLIGKEITIDVARDCLSDLLRSADRKVTVECIMRKVADHYDVKVSDLIGGSRVRSISRPRQVAMYLSKQLTRRSYPEIGKRFGGKDHTTVLHACRKIEDLRRTDTDLDGDIEALRRGLEP